MSWTPIADADLCVLVNELHLAIKERLIAAFDTVDPEINDPIPVGTDIQSVAFWQGILDTISTNCIYFLRIDSPLPFPETYSVSSLATTAGINSAGPRHSSDFSTFEYGWSCTEGEIIGPWLIEDIQKLLSVMRWTLRHSTDSTNGWSKSITENDVATANTNWAASSPGSGDGVLYRAEVLVLGPVTETRIKAQPTLSGIPTTNPCSKDIWADTVTSLPGSTFYDIDGVGLTDGVVFFIGSVGSGAFSTCTGPYITATEEAPFITMGIVDPADPVWKSCVVAGNTSWILKWTFTNY